MDEIDHLRILFLSYESSHNEIFLKVIDELRKRSDVWFKILDSNQLFPRPVSIRFSYKKEISNFEQIIDQVRPDVFVVANDQGISTTFIRICRLRGIPSLAIQDGILTETKKSKGTFSFLKWRRYLPWRIISSFLDTRAVSKLFIRMGHQWAIPCWGLGGASKIAVMGEYYKRMFVHRGICPDKIVVTGYPLLDDVLKNLKYRARVSKEQLFETIGLQSDEPFILLITQPFVEDGAWSPVVRDLFVEWVINSIRLTEYQLIIKVHPRENLEAYKKFIDKYRDFKIIVTKDSDLHKLVQVSDGAITVSSTAGLWVLAYEKPLLVANCFYCGTEKNVLEDMGIVINEMGDLSKKLYLIHDAQLKPNEPEKNSALQKHLYHLDGKAGERIANLICALGKNTRGKANIQIAKS